jgi:RimJ/RimL family protein N-acetyltransferase
VRRFSRIAMTIFKINPAGVERDLASMFHANSPDRARLHAVLEGRSLGHVLVDSPTEPNWCVVREPSYGRTFFGGNLTDRDVHDVIAEMRKNGQVVVDAKDSFRAAFPQDSTDEESRLEFRASLSDTPNLQTILRKEPQGCTIRTIDAAGFEQCQWRSLIRLVFGTLERFLEESVGFALFEGDALVSEAHAVFWGRGVAEIGAITRADRRGRGYAPAVVAHLVNACEKRGAITYWGCDKTNPASAAVARRIGYGSPREYSVLVYPPFSEK